MVKIGLIDDHALFRKGFTILLEQLNYKVIIEAGHGKSFIHQVNEKNQPDIILLDTHLYVMDSYDVLQWIKINYPHIPVVLLHSRNDQQILEKLLRAGAAAFIAKSALPNEVNRVIKEVIGSSNYYSP